MNARAAAIPIALVALALGGAAYLTLVDARRPSDADREARPRAVFPVLRVEQVTRVTLRAAGVEVAVTRDDEAGGWRLGAPRDEPADAAAVDRMLRDLEMATRLREAPASALGPVRVEGTLRAGAVDYRFALGADAPSPEGAAYLRLDGEGTFVVARALASQLLEGPEAYRVRALAPVAAADVERVEVRGPAGEGFVLARRGPGFRAGDGGPRASRAAVERIFAGLADVRADAFLPDDTASAPEALDLTVVSRAAGAPRYALRLGGGCPGGRPGVVAVRVAPRRAAACVPASALSSLRIDVAKLPDEALFVAHADEIAELRLEPAGRGAPIELARRGSGWHERSPEDRDLEHADADPAQALVADLAAATGTLVPSGSAVFTPASRARIVRAGGQTVEALEVGARGDDGSALVRRLDDGAVLRVGRQVARRLAPQPVAVRGARVWASVFDAANVDGIRSTCGPAPEELDRRGGRWRLVSPGGLGADVPGVEALVRSLAGAGAAAWISEGDDGSFGLGAGCEVEVRVAAEGGDRRAAITFGDDEGEGVYARASGDPAVFVAPATLRDAATRLYADRTAFDLGSGVVERLSMAAGDAGAETLVAAEAGSDPRLGRAARFTVAAALHAGAPARAEGLDAPTLEILAKRPADAASASEVRIVVGAPTTWSGEAGYFVRMSGTNATFFAEARVVDGILNAR